MDESWLCLFSGGKDSSLALHRAREAGLAVDSLLVVHPGADSYMFHVPATDLAGLAAESIGLPLHEVDPGDLGATDATDATAQGDAETAVLRDAVADLPGDPTGLVAGAVESAFQTDRIRGICADLDLDLFAPLWREDPADLAEELLAAGFEVRVVAVAARGLEASWLGRTLDRAAFEELAGLNDRYGVHLLGEGGEFETVVTDGPHMDQRIEFDADPVWEGTRGHLRIEDAWLE